MRGRARGVRTHVGFPCHCQTFVCVCIMHCPCYRRHSGTRSCLAGVAPASCPFMGRCRLREHIGFTGEVVTISPCHHCQKRASQRCGGCSLFSHPVCYVHRCLNGCPAIPARKPQSRRSRSLGQVSQRSSFPIIYYHAMRFGWTMPAYTRSRSKRNHCIYLASTLWRDRPRFASRASCSAHLRWTPNCGTI